MDVPPPPASHRPPLIATRGLGTTSVVLLAVQAAGGVIGLLGLAQRITVLHAVQSGRVVTQAQVDAANLGVVVPNALVLLILLPTIVVWCIWQHRAQRNATELAGGGLRFTPAMAVAWWFIPIASLWKPFQAMRELWRASHGPAWVSDPTWVVLGWWWATWLLSFLSGTGDGTGTLGASAQAPLSVSDMLTRDTSLLVFGGARVVAAVLAILIVRSVQRLQSAGAAGLDPVTVPTAPPLLAGAPAPREEPQVPASPRLAPSVDDRASRSERGLVLATVIVIAIVAIGGLAWSRGNHFPAPAVAVTEDTVGTTFNDHGVTFRYPVSWTSEPVVTLGAVGTTASWREGFTPVNAQRLELVIVSQYDLPYETSNESQADLQNEVDQVTQQFAQQIDGEVTSDVMSAALGSLDGFTVQLRGTLEGTPVWIQFNAAFDGQTEYRVVCQSTAATLTTIGVGCATIKKTFAVVGGG